MSPELPTLLVARNPRPLDGAWPDTVRSWLGGAPRLGKAAWPRDDQGVPLHFAAHIDLAEVAALTGAAAFAAGGSLAFFIGGRGCGAVIYVPPGEADAPSLPPDDTPPLSKSGGDARWPHDHSGRMLFPFWPVNLYRLAVTTPDPQGAEAAASAAQMAAEVRRCVPQGSSVLSWQDAFAGPAIPDWWQTAIFLAQDLAAKASGDTLSKAEASLASARERLEQAKDGDARAKAEKWVANREAEVAKLSAMYPALRSHAADVAAWVAGRDPWAVMSASDLAQLDRYCQRKAEFRDLLDHSMKDLIYRLKNSMFDTLPAEQDAAFAALPESVQAVIRRRRAPRPQWWNSALQFAAAVRNVPNGLEYWVEQDQKRLAADRETLAQARAALRPTGWRGLLRRLFGRKDEAAEARVAALAEQLRAKVAAHEARLVMDQTLRDTADAFVRETDAWVAGRSRWARMSDDEAASLHARIARANETFVLPLVRYQKKFWIDTYEYETVWALATGPDEHFVTLPEEVRAFFNENRLLPGGGREWHQMFGRGAEIQWESASMREEGNIMLLQLTHDNMMAWGFGDAGVYQWWMTPEDLAAGNWSRVATTFEMR